MLTNGEQMVGGYGGLSFAQTGILYAIPNLTDTRASAPSPEDIYDRYDTMRDLRSDMEKLRQGDTVSDKLSRLTFKVWAKDEQGQLEARDVIIWLTARDAQHGVFFGDRPLDNPGYSAFMLNGAVGHKGANDRVDVARVEQRLKYLGFSGFEKTRNNRLREFTVDGRWDVREDTALRGFYVATNYTKPAYWWEIPGGFGYEATALNKPDARTVAAGLPNFGWLNAFNAPHMIDMYAALPMDRSMKQAPINRFQSGHTRVANIEAYATSWVFDWLQAWRQSQDAFDRLSAADRAQVLDVNKEVRIAGFTSPSGYSPSGQHEAGGHSTLMAVDWSLLGDIGLQTTTKFNSPGEILTSTDPRGWNLANALAWIKRLEDQKDKNPGEAAALTKFLSLYSLTRDNQTLGKPDGGWEDITAQNGDKVKRALFGDGDGQAIQAAFLGMAGQRTYPRMREIIEALGLQHIKPSSGDHHTHFHIDFRTPDLQEISQNLLAQPLAVQDPAHSATDEGDEVMLLLNALLAGAAIAADPGMDPQVMAQATVKTNHAIALCTAVESYFDRNMEARDRRGTQTYVEQAAYEYLRFHLKREPAPKEFPPSAVTVEKPPKHGTLYVRPAEGLGEIAAWHYTPNLDFEKGIDSATFLVSQPTEILHRIYRNEASMRSTHAVAAQSRATKIGDCSGQAAGHTPER
ncbi:MAG: hypothetical protein Q8K34_16195, partial [Hydrogenophaga sp.]|nr:hypothetical protein [Hydrogenophaga sp.]